MLLGSALLHLDSELDARVLSPHWLSDCWTSHLSYGLLASFELFSFRPAVWCNYVFSGRVDIALKLCLLEKTLRCAFLLSDCWYMVTVSQTCLSKAGRQLRPWAVLSPLLKRGIVGWRDGRKRFCCGLLNKRLCAVLLLIFLEVGWWVLNMKMSGCINQTRMWYKIYPKFKNPLFAPVSTRHESASCEIPFGPSGVGVSIIGCSFCKQWICKLWNIIRSVRSGSHWVIWILYWCYRASCFPRALVRWAFIFRSYIGTAKRSERTCRVTGAAFFW